MQRDIAPLSNGFFITGIIGFLVSVFYIYPRSPSWGFTLIILSAILFLSCIISMRHAPIEAQLAIDDKKKKKKQL